MDGCFGKFWEFCYDKVEKHVRPEQLLDIFHIIWSLLNQGTMGFIVSWSNQIIIGNQNARAFSFNMTLPTVSLNLTQNGKWAITVNQHDISIPTLMDKW